MAISNFCEETTKKFTGTISLNSATPDITGDTVTLYMYQQEGDGTIEKAADVSIGSGQYEVTLTKADTDVTPGNWSYEIWWARASGPAYRLEYGKVTIFNSEVKE